MSHPQTHLFSQEVTTALEQFSHYNAIWEKDREADLEEFLKDDPKLPEFEAQVKNYEELEVEIMGLAEFYDVGPIALYTGQYTWIGVDTEANDLGSGDEEMMVDKK